MPTVADVGEDGLVAAVLARLGASASGARPGVVVAAGDDAAVLMGAGDVVLSTDTLVSGADFRTDWSSGADVGVKAAAAALADVAAMGARPVALLVSLTVPGGTDLDWVLDLATGLAEESARAGADVVGGDVAAGREIVVTGTASGRLPVGSSPVLRSGAAAGDIVALAGRLGDSRAGLALLERYGSQVDTFGDQALQVLAAHRRPRPPYAAGPAAADGAATSLIDVSDGLIRDGRRVATASSVVLDLAPGELQPSAAAQAVARLLDADPKAWVLTGGEDHALLATFPAERVPPEGYRVIGRVISPRPGLPAGSVSLAGRPWEGPGGFVAFR